jgi:biotin transport system substrate-specific component
MTLADTIWPAQAEAGWRALRIVLLALVGSVFVAGMAQFKFYFPDNPVPFTMQPLAVLLIGAAYGPRLGAATLLLYLAEGAVGLPFFADGKGGWEVLRGATAGYLVGFVLAAGLVGWLAERGWDRSIPSTVVAMAAGMVLIYLPGSLWLATFPSINGLGAAFAKGVLPFLLWDAIKIAAAALILPGAWALLGRDGR